MSKMPHTIPHDFEKRLAKFLVEYVAAPPIQVEPAEWIHFARIPTPNTTREASAIAENIETKDQIIRNFIAKGDKASFVNDITIANLGELIGGLTDEFDLNYPHETLECNSKKITVILLWMFPTKIHEEGLFGGSDFELTIGDLKEAIDLGHWHCKYAYQGDEVVHESFAYNVMLIIFLVALCLGIAKWYFEAFPSL